MKLPKDFTEYYNKLTIPHPPLTTFLTLDFKFTIGIYLDYFTSRGITIDVSTIGFLIRKYPTTNPDDTILLEVIFESELDIILAFSKAIQDTINYLENPF